MQYLLNQDEYHEYQQLKQQVSGDGVYKYNVAMEKATEEIINDAIATYQADALATTADIIANTCWEVYHKMCRTGNYKV